MNWQSQIEEWKARQVAAGKAAVVIIGHRGYADYPGSGPEGETCRSCDHYERTSTGGNKHYLKCGLMRAVRTHGPGTDIKAGSPACSKWEKKVA